MDDGNHFEATSNPPTVAHLLAGGELLRTQLPGANTWSPEKKLAAAVLTSALLSVRNHYGDPAHAETVAEDLAWIESDDGAYPFSFLTLCEVFDLESAWVRETVERWKRSPRKERAPFTLHRYAA